MSERNGLHRNMSHVSSFLFELDDHLVALATRTCCEVGGARGAAWSMGLALLDLIQVSHPQTNVTSEMLVAIPVLGH